MSVVRAIFSNFTAFILSFILTVIPYKGVNLPVIDTAEDNCIINIALLSDTHIEEKELFRRIFLKAALNNINHSKAAVDAIAVTGDLTNYADEPALAEYFRIISEYTNIPVISVAGNHDIGHAGDRDVTDISREEAYANYLRYRNNYTGRNDETNYYSFDIKGYRFIVLGDEVIDGGKWDGITMSQEQLDFLDSELADGTKDGKPVFVLSHWPLEGKNGEQIIWPDSGIEKDRYDLSQILEKYKNVFYISGHMHAGVKSEAIQKMYGLSSAEQINGVTYINLPTFGIINSFGLFWSGTGAQLEVYEGKVIYRPRNMITNNWYENATFEFEIV